ncbi:MAG: hypothetical protein M0Q91_11020 [Methanoregula sp.]|jgi:hypothetical protein|nr:hypothetical protein [Methanoregula sp.]
MQSGSIIFVIVFCSIVIAGCIQLPGMHILSNTPDPVIGQWIGGELPASDRHIILYENQTFFLTNFFLNRGETTDTGTWTKKEPGLYSMQSVTGETNDWVYDSFDDSLYMSGLPQMKYHRYKG